MNVASLELCKELYELSGWGIDTYFVYSGDELIRTIDAIPLNFQVKHIPGYDLGYLLRKLQVGRYTAVSFSQMGWGAICNIDENTEYTIQADTPEHAACKLAIELFKQGVLKRD